jgi:hypothetical protein
MADPGTVRVLRRLALMSDPQNRHQDRHQDRPKPPPAPAETARQEGAQGRIGKAPGDMVGDGEIDASDPKVTEIAGQVHANA